MSFEVHSSKNHLSKKRTIGGLKPSYFGVFITDIGLVYTGSIQTVSRQSKLIITRQLREDIQEKKRAILINFDNFRPFLVTLRPIKALLNFSLHFFNHTNINRYFGGHNSL